MLNSHTPNRESGPPGPVGGRLAVSPVQDLSDGARALNPPEQGAGNGLLDQARPPTSGSALNTGRDARPASSDSECRRDTPYRVERRTVNPSLPDVSGEQGGHTDSQLRCNEYLYCAATSQFVPSVTNPHSIAGSEVERGSTGRPLIDGPDAVSWSRPRRRGRHALDVPRSGRLFDSRAPPQVDAFPPQRGDLRRSRATDESVHRNGIRIGVKRCRPERDGQFRETTAGEVPAQMRMTAHTGLATERRPARVRTPSRHRGKVQFDDRTATDRLQNGGDPGGSR